MGTHYLGLSLFIILLSFFLILNGMSGFDNTKSQSIMASVDFAFSTNILGEDITPNQQGVEEQEYQDGNVLKDIRAAFDTQISSFQVKETRDGKTMLISLPFQEFKSMVFSIARDGISEERMLENEVPLFLKTLISLLQTGQDNHPYRMDMSLEIARESYSIEMLKEKAADIGSVVDVLTKAGLPRELISSGVRDGNADVIELVFQPIQDNPKKYLIDE